MKSPAILEQRKLGGGGTWIRGIKEEWGVKG